MHIQLSTQKPIKLFGIKIFIERDNPNVINILSIYNRLLLNIL